MILEYTCQECGLTFTHEVMDGIKIAPTCIFCRLRAMAGKINYTLAKCVSISYTNRWR